MALAPYLVDTYAEYKKGTSTFVQWLAQTARATGTVDSLFGPAIPVASSASTGRLKGKARSQAKKTGPKSAQETQHVSISTFTQLARAIAKSKDAKVPSSIFTIIRNVIRGRKECATWFVGNQIDATGTVKENNDRHRYFIAVLEEVLEILSIKNVRPNTPVRQPAVSMDRVVNMYEHLNPGHDDESDIAETLATTEIESNRVSYKLETQEDELSFAIYCLLRDATSLRVFVRRTWREFKAGVIGLQTAALTMNGAITKIREMSDEFKNTNQKFQKNVHSHIVDFVNETCLDKHTKSARPAQVDTNDDTSRFSYNHDGQKLERNTVTCYHTTQILLRCFLRYDSAEHPLSLDEIRLLKCLFQLVALMPSDKQVLEIFQRDMVYEAVLSIHQKHDFDTWAVFAVQMLWDAQRELGNLLCEGENILRQAGQKLEQDYVQYLNTEGLEKVGQGHAKHYRRFVENRHETVKAVALDGSFQTVIDYVAKIPTRFKKHPPFPLLQNNPALCGMFIVNMRMDWHMHGIDVAASQGQVLVAAHLYNAAHQTGRLSKDVRWADMEWFIKHQDSHWIFAGGVPKKSSEFGPRLVKAMGFTVPKAPARGQAFQERSAHVGKNRRLRYVTRCAELIVERDNVGRPSESSKIDKNTSGMAEALAIDYLGSQKTFRRMSPAKRLVAFKEAIAKDEPAFYFNFVELHTRCIRLLQRIQDHCHQNAPIDYPRSKYAGDLSMNTLINSILNTINMSGCNRPMFPAAVQILRELIDKEGDLGLSTARMQQEKEMLPKSESDLELEPSFENLDGDFVPLDFRDKVPQIMAEDDQGKWRPMFE